MNKWVMWMIGILAVGNMLESAALMHRLPASIVAAQQAVAEMQSQVAQTDENAADDDDGGVHCDNAVVRIVGSDDEFYAHDVTIDFKAGVVGMSVYEDPYYKTGEYFCIVSLGNVIISRLSNE